MMVAALLVAVAVASPPPQEFTPSWSPDGTAIAFIGGSRRRDLYVVRADGTGLRRLAATRLPESIAPSWSPDGRRIAFTRGGLDLRRGFQVMVVNRDGTGLRRVADGLAPVWSPDGGRLAFTRDSKLYVLRFPGGNPRLLAASATPPLAWSPDGTRLAFSFNNQVFAADTRTKARTLISGGALPSWSPDGHTIAIMLFCKPFFIAMGTFGPPGINDCGFPAGVDGPARWSPDSADVAYSFCLTGFCTLYVQPVVGGRVLNEVHSAEQPSWSPSGTTIVYVHTDYATSQLYVTSPGGGAGRPLFGGRG